MADSVSIEITTQPQVIIEIPVGAPGPPGADGQAQLAAHESASNPHPQYQAELIDEVLTFTVVPTFSLGLISGVPGEIRLNVLEPFDDPLATLSIGDAGNPQRLVRTGQVILDQPNVSSVNPSVDLGMSGVQINAYLNAAQSTTGKVKVVIYEG